MRFSTELLLIMQSSVTGLILIVAFIFLNRRGLFKWTTTGFWAWSSFALYYLVSPLSTVLSRNTYLYDRVLLIAGGTDRGLWILFVSVIGILVFFIAYLKTKTYPITWRLAPSSNRITFLSVFVLTIFLSISFYSLFVFWSFLIPAARDLIIEQGRFTGETSGYEYVSFMFLFVPSIFFMVSRSRGFRLFGYTIAIIFVLLSLPNGWSRYITVSMVVALSIIYTIKNKRRWPKWIFIILIFVFAAALQIRGHAGWDLISTPNELLVLVPRTATDIGNVFGSVDTNMLATWYLESFIKDSLTGYDYGIPLLNYLLTGWIPYQIFPQKYLLIDWLNASRYSIFSTSIENLMYGAKSSLMGSFYSNGGIVGVVLLMFCAGFLSRRMDGMISDTSPNIIKAVGVSWMSILWMVWGSHDYWGLSAMGILALPALFLWVVLPKKGIVGTG